jgi:hypothetical protein
LANYTILGFTFKSRGKRSLHLGSCSLALRVSSRGYSVEPFVTTGVSTGFYQATSKQL